MPYLKPKDRIAAMGWTETAGDLNYRFTMLIKQHIEKMGESYQTYNDIIGALECCKLELYRRKVEYYENQKCLENGDVW